MQTVSVGNCLSPRPLPQELLITLLGNQLLHHSSSRVSAIGLIQILESTRVFRRLQSICSIKTCQTRLPDLSSSRDEKPTIHSPHELNLRCLTASIEFEPSSMRKDSPENDWTLLSYSLPVERRSSRDRLRRRLTFLGYGNLRDGQWIAPGDRSLETDAVIRELELEQHVELFLGRPAMTTDPGRMIACSLGAS